MVEAPESLKSWGEIFPDHDLKKDAFEELVDSVRVTLSGRHPWFREVVTLDEVTGNSVFSFAYPDGRITFELQADGDFAAHVRQLNENGNGDTFTEYHIAAEGGDRHTGLSQKHINDLASATYNAHVRQRQVVDSEKKGGTLLGVSTPDYIHAVTTSLRLGNNLGLLEGYLALAHVAWPEDEWVRVGFKIYDREALEGVMQLIDSREIQPDTARVMGVFMETRSS